MTESERNETAIIVFEGSINPAIISAQWLSAQKLVDPKEAAAANIRFMDPDFSRFDVSHFRIEARHDRITVAPTKALETYDPVQDFVQGIFEVLNHTPIDAVAISKVVHAGLPAGGWVRLNERLLGPANWAEIVPDPTLKLLSITSAGAEENAVIEVTVEQSQHIHGGIYVVATERTTIPNAFEENRGAREALDILGRRWDPWLAQADRMIEQIVAMA